VSAEIGSVLAGVQAAMNPNSPIADIIKASLVGAASNFLNGKALFNAVNALLGNLANQVTDPCFDCVNVQQAIAAAFLAMICMLAFGYLTRVHIWSPPVLQGLTHR
jgi:hypothetical protein